MLAGVQRPTGVVQSHGGAADALGHHPYFGVMLDDGEILNDLIFKGVAGIVPTGEDVLDLHWIVHPLGNVGAVLVQNLCHAAAHGAVP